MSVSRQIRERNALAVRARKQEAREKAEGKEPRRERLVDRVVAYLQRKDRP